MAGCRIGHAGRYFIEGTGLGDAAGFQFGTVTIHQSPSRSQTAVQVIVTGAIPYRGLMAQVCLAGYRLGMLRIRPSCITDTTRLPSWNTWPLARPRAPNADGDSCA